MTESELLGHWSKLRNHLIAAQAAPTFLLITTVGLVPALKTAAVFTQIAILGILLASGILGALVEYSAAAEAEALAQDLKTAGAISATAASVVASARWLFVPKFVTPAIFVAIFVALVAAILF